MAQNDYDQASRFLAKVDPSGMIGWLLGLPPSGFRFVRWLDTRGIAFPGEPDSVRDTVAHVEDVQRGQVPWAIVLEFQYQPDPLMFGRLLVYDGGVWLERKPTGLTGDRFELGAIMVNLTGRGNAARRSEWPEAGLLTALIPREINLSQQDAALTLDGVEAGTIARVVLPFIPLMTGGDDPSIMQRWTVLASAEPDERRRGDYGGLALVFAELAQCRPAWKIALGGWNMVQSQQVLEWQAEARIADRIETILNVLQTRFKTLPQDLTAAIQTTTDLGILRQWIIEAATVASLADFRQTTGI